MEEKSFCVDLSLLTVTGAGETKDETKPEHVHL